MILTMDAPMTCRQISEATGGAVSEEFVRAACHRGEGFHPLPHTRSGERRPVIRVRMSVFERWYAEEELMTVGAGA